MNKDQEKATTSKSKKNKAVYIASSANIMSIGFNKETGEAEVKLKSGGVAPGINDVIPEDGYDKVGWLGIQESPVAAPNSEKPFEEIQDKKDALIQALRTWEVANNVPEGQNDFVFVDKETFDDFYKGATNGIMWPLIHSMPEKVATDRNLDSHAAVDWEYTETLLNQINKDINDPENSKINSYNDVVVWVHDYHMFQVPGMLKEAIAQQNKKAGILVAKIENGDVVKINYDALTKEEFKELDEKEDQKILKDKKGTVILDGKRNITLLDVPVKKIEGDINVSFFHHETWPNIFPGRRKNNDNDVDHIYLGDAPGLGQEQLTALDDRFKTIFENLIKADSLGFHTRDDASSFKKTLKNFNIPIDEKELEKKVFVNPIGIPKARLQRELLERIPVLKEGLNNYQGERTPFVVALEKQATALEAKNSAAFLETFANTNSSEVERNSKLKEISTLGKACDRVLKGGASLHDYQTVMEGVHFNPEKIHMASVSRFDYTKGLLEVLQGYQNFLRDEKSKTNINPGNIYQFNLVTGAGRSSPIPAYENYADDVIALRDEINKEFPRAIYHYPKGINNSELPVFDGMIDIGVAASIKDGYILSIGEIMAARNSVLAHKDVRSLVTHQASGVIISNGAGITEDLVGESRVSNKETLTIVSPNVLDFKHAFKIQTDKIKKIRKYQEPVLDAKNKEELNKLVNKITDADNFGLAAFQKISQRDQERKSSLKAKASSSKKPRTGPIERSKSLK